MKIYTEVVIDMESGKVLSEKASDYCGQIALVKGGGGSTINSTDPIYNAGMLALSQDQQGMADKLFNQYMYGVEYDPTASQKGMWLDANNKRVAAGATGAKWVSEDELGNVDYAKDFMIANPDLAEGTGKGHWETTYQAGAEGPSGGSSTRTWVPDEAVKDTPKYIVNPDMLDSRTMAEIMGYSPTAQTSESQYYQNLVNANQKLLGSQTEAELAQLGLTQEQIAAERSLLGPTTDLALKTIQDKSAGMDLKAPIRAEYARSVMEPIDITGKMNAAQAGVQQSYDNAGGQFKRQMFTSGVNPGDGAFVSEINSRNLAMAGDIAAARQKAKTTAEDTQFNRLQSAMTTGF